MNGWEGEYTDWMLLQTQGQRQSQGRHPLDNMLYRRRLETSDLDDKPIKKLFTEIRNQVKSWVIFSYAYI